MQWLMSLWMSGNKPYGPPPDEAAAYERLFIIPCEHAISVPERDDAKMTRTLDPAVTGSATLAFMLEGFRRLYGKGEGRDSGNLREPEFARVAKHDLRNTLDPYTDIIEPNNGRDAFIVVTGDLEDGVVVSEVWEYVQAALEVRGVRVRRVSDEKAKLASALERRGAFSKRTSARFGNREGWVGVRWSEAIAKSGRVSLPDWQVSKRADT